MAWKDEINNAKKLFKHGTFKQKAEYIFDYYKWHIVAIIFILCLIGNLVYYNITEKECVLQGVFLNHFTESDVLVDLQNDFIKHFPINVSSEEIFFDSLFYYSHETDAEILTTSYETAQILTARLSAGEIDFIIADSFTLNEFIYSEYCHDLSTVLTDKQWELLEPYFLYYDKAIVNQIAEKDFMSEKISDINFPDPSKPEHMDVPIPVMINVSACEEIQMLYPNATQDLAMAFIINSSNSENALEFLNYLMQ